MARPKGAVVWTDAASADLVEIVSFVAADSPAAARKLVDRLRTRADSLADLSKRGRIVPELASSGDRAWREVQVKPYRLIYRVGGRTVVVGAVLDSRRDLEEVLLERLVRSD